MSMSYWIDTYKADMCRWMGECEKDNECDSCPYHDICNDLEVELID